ncbi:MAG TPA: menaquinone biosynthesis protein [Terriglobales bacterium]|nr:menaquinone biosynthesis protein [Terriglobales bacterium]
MARLRISAISYLNTAPLMWDFEQGPRSSELRQEFQIDYTIPSRCAQMLAQGSADIGIIPVAAYATIPGLLILPDVAIASKNAVASIVLVSKLPLQRIQTVALDSSSRSSAALTQILFAKYWQQRVQFAPAEPELDSMLAKHDAALVIGDPALQVNRSLYHTWDLGEEWRNFTGKPFVFAFWAVRAQAASEDELARVAEIFCHSRDEGLKHTSELVSEWSLRLGLAPALIESYLRDNIHYYLDGENLEGLGLFFQLAFELGILPPAPELRFAQELEIRNSALGNRF